MIFLFESSLCLIFFYLLYHYLYRGSSNHSLNRIYLITTLLASLIIPIISLPIFNEIIEVSRQVPVLINTKEIAIIKPQTFNWSNIWILLYGSGVIASLLILLRNINRIYKVIKDGESDNYIGQKIIYTNNDISLCSIGAYILAPTNRKGNLSKYELTHEENHILLNHSADILFIKVLRCFYWFNPILLFYERSLEEIHEYQADKATIDLLGSDSYQSFLINQVSKSYQYPLVHNFNSLIKKRLLMMSSESRSSKAKYFAALPLLIGTLFMFSCESYPTYVDSNGAETSMTQDTIFTGAGIELAMTQGTIFPDTSIDTITFYNYKLKKEVNRILVSPRQQDAYLLESSDPDVTSIEVIATNIVIDYDTKEEFVAIVKSTFDLIDTIVTIDYDTYRETAVVINHKTGIIDTLYGDK